MINLLTLAQSDEATIRDIVRPMDEMIVFDAISEVVVAVRNHAATVLAGRESVPKPEDITERVRAALNARDRKAVSRELTDHQLSTSDIQEAADYVFRLFEWEKSGDTRSVPTRHRV